MQLPPRAASYPVSLCGLRMWLRRCRRWYVPARRELALPEVHCRASLQEEDEMADKPSKGLADVVAASTAFSDIDGQTGACSTAATTSISWPGRRPSRRSPTCCSAGRRPAAASWAATGPNWPPGGAWASWSAPCCRRSRPAQGPMEAMRSLVSLASADDPDESRTRAARTSARPPGSPRSSPSWWRPTTRPAQGRECVPADPGPQPGRQLPAPVARRRPRRSVMLRSWTHAWCCTRTTR